MKLQNSKSAKLVQSNLLETAPGCSPASSEPWRSTSSQARCTGANWRRSAQRARGNRRGTGSSAYVGFRALSKTVKFLFRHNSSFGKTNRIKAKKGQFKRVFRSEVFSSKFLTSANLNFPRPSVLEIK